MGAEQKHDQYGKAVLSQAIGAAFSANGAVLSVDYGKGGHARIDGVIGPDIAVEVESRASKQVRGALVDLIHHPHRRKLVVLVPVHMCNIETTAAQCEVVLHKVLSQDDCLIVILSGNGHQHRQEADVKTLQDALRQKGWIE